MFSSNNKPRNSAIRQMQELEEYAASLEETGSKKVGLAARDVQETPDRAQSVFDDILSYMRKKYQETPPPTPPVSTDLLPSDMPDVVPTSVSPNGEVMYATPEAETDVIMPERPADEPKGMGIMRPKARPEGLTQAPENLEIPEYKTYKSPNEMSELEILARTIEAEAASEPLDGKVAVGATIANRAASGKYGKGIKGVILKKGQFSPWNSWTGYAKGEQGKDMMKLRPSEDAYKAAQSILTGNYEDTTGGATHYLNPEVSQPYWLDDMIGRDRGTVKIGRHLFGNADSNKTYDGKAWITKRSEDT